MYVDHLVLEITRRCNASCSHCLRGNAENHDMSFSVINKILENVSTIELVTFSGGEPSLVPEKIEYFLNWVKENKIKLKNFCVITNGKIASRELVQVLIEMYAYTKKFFEIDCSKLIISKDHFHKKEIPDVSEAENLYSSLKFFDPNEKLTLTDEEIVNEGRCVDFSYGHEAYSDSIRLKRDTNGKIVFVGGILFVTALGDIVMSSDLSYDSEEKQKIGNILDNDLVDILEDYKKKKEGN